jgi:hypothetical protein
MTDFFQDLVDSTKDVAWEDIFDIVFHSEYYPTFYIIHCVFVCAYLRISAGSGGLQWWRSFLLGLALSYGTRYTFSWLISRTFPESSSPLTVIYYASVWAVFNFCPYDLVFRFVRRSVPLYILAFFVEFGNGQLLIHYLWNANQAFPEKVLTTVLITTAAYAAPMAVDWFDNVAFRPKRRFMFYPWTYLKRVFVEAGVVMIATVPITVSVLGRTFAIEEPWSHMYGLVPWNAGVNGVLKLIDGIFTRDIFGVVDFVLPIQLCRLVGSYHPGRVKAVR